MGTTVYGRRELRRIEVATGHRVVHSAGGFYTTIDHRHGYWDEASGTWTTRTTTCAPYSSSGGVCIRASSCTILFGGANNRLLMHAPSSHCTCTAEPGDLHEGNCAALDKMLGWVPPNYWPTPVHQPGWWRRHPHGDRYRAAYRARALLREALL